MVFFVITGHDVPQPPAVFFHEDEGGKLAPRPQYADLACRVCGKFDELEALSRGVDDKIVIRTKRNIFPSMEDMTIVDRRARAVLESIDGIQLSFFQFPQSPGYHVAVPKLLIQPRSGDQGFRFHPQCKACSRHQQILFGNGLPAIPEGASFGGFGMESRLAMKPILFASEAIAKKLQAITPPLAKLVAQRLPIVPDESCV